METLGEVSSTRATLQETMNFLGAIAGGIEDAVGETANNVTYVAGYELGKAFSATSPKTDDIEKALQEVEKVLKANQCLWSFETFHPKDHENLVKETEEGDEIMLVFRDCMIRQSLFMFGHHQKGSLCTMMYGFFSGALETIMGRESRLEIVHAGENACYKRLIVQR